MAHIPSSFRCAIASCCVVTLTACADSTGPDLSQGPYLFRAVAAGPTHTCGIQADSTLLCWGRGGYLGTGLSDSRWTPAPVESQHRFTAVHSGQWQTCGLAADSTAYCWDYAELPTPIPDGHRFTAISVGGAHACGIAADGTAYCWGWNDSGQLGDGTTEPTFGDGTSEPRTTPTAVAGEMRFTDIGTGLDHTCALAESGEAYCWGLNRFGQLGDRTVTMRLTPTPVSSSSRFLSVEAGGSLSCGITLDEEVHCWGLGSVLGTATTETCTVEGHDYGCSTTPLVVLGDVAYRDVSAGYGFACALTTTGAAYCWGANSYGQLGDGTTESRDAPTPVGGAARFAAISTNIWHTCGLSAEGVLYCWGNNEYGQLGDGSGSGGWSIPAVVWGW